MMRRWVSSLALAWLAVAPVAAAQPSTPGEQMGLAEEFGAFADAETSNKMVSDCQAQTPKLSSGISVWRRAADRYRAATAASERRLASVRQAADALQEAEDRARSLSGGAAAQFEADVVRPRRQALQMAEDASRTAPEDANRALAQFYRDAEEARRYFRSIGMDPAEMTGTAEAVLQRQTARCQRMQAWAMQGSVARAQLREPVPISSWPDGAVDGWKGYWSCRWRSTARSGTAETAIGANANAWYESDGTVVVHFSTEWARTFPSDHASHLFSPLVVRQSQPTRGAFANRDGSGEERAGFDVVDSAAISGDGRLRLQRRYATQPERQDDLECARGK